MLVILVFPLLYIAGAISLFGGIAPGQLKDPTLLAHLFMIGLGVALLALGAFCHRECRRCRDVPGYYAKHYGLFRDLNRRDD